MSISIIVIGLVVIFIIGNLMGLKPRPYEMRLGELRLLARQLGLHPKFANPQWLNTKQNLIQYTLINDDWRLTMACFTAIDGIWHGDMPHALQDQPIMLPAQLLPHIKGMALKSNSISVYWHDEDYIKSFDIRQQDISNLTAQDLNTLKHYLTQIAVMSK